MSCDPRRWEYRVNALERCSCNPLYKGAVTVLDYAKNVVINVDFNDIFAVWRRVDVHFEAVGFQLIVTVLVFRSLLDLIARL
jgi:hypothetical protein